MSLINYNWEDISLIATSEHTLADLLEEMSFPRCCSPFLPTELQFHLIRNKNVLGGFIRCL